MLAIIPVNLMNIHQRIKEILPYGLNNDFSQISNIKMQPQVNMFFVEKRKSMFYPYSTCVKISVVN